MAILDRLAKIETKLDTLAVPPPASSGQQSQQPLSQLPPIQYHPPLSQPFKVGHLPLTPPIPASHTSPTNVGGILPPTTSAGSTITSTVPDLNSHFSPTANIQVAHLPPPRQPQKEKRLSRLAAVGSTCQNVLRWPIFEGAYDPDTILAPLFEDDSDESDDESDDDDDDKVRWGRHKRSATDVDEKELERYDLRHLIERFLTNVQTKNPILDQGILEEYVDEIERRGFDGSGESCIVVSLQSPYDLQLMLTFPLAHGLCSRRCLCTVL